jgi:hypothetical protein
VVYRGGVHPGEHEPILARDLFEAVQAKLAGNAVARQLRLKGSAAILTGRIFDDRGNRLSPTHSNKRGVRSRYCVSHSLLQNRNTAAGSVGRVPAPDIEALVLESFEHRRKRAEIHVQGCGEIADPLGVMFPQDHKDQILRIGHRELGCGGVSCAVRVFYALQH